MTMHAFIMLLDDGMYGGADVAIIEFDLPALYKHHFQSHEDIDWVNVEERLGWLNIILPRILRVLNKKFNGHLDW